MTAKVAVLEIPIAIDSPWGVAFQQDAFQSDAFQMSPVASATDASDPATP